MPITMNCPYCLTSTREKGKKVYCPTCNKSRIVVKGLPSWSLK